MNFDGAVISCVICVNVGLMALLSGLFARLAPQQQHRLSPLHSVPIKRLAILAFISCILFSFLILTVHTGKPFQLLKIVLALRILVLIECVLVLLHGIVCRSAFLLGCQGVLIKAHAVVYLCLRLLPILHHSFRDTK